jgi:hypothetical protein
MKTATLFAELARRNVIRVAGLYLVAAWLATQVAGTVLPMFGAPGWVARSVVIVLAIGFLPAMGVAWVFELTPEGLYAYRGDADQAFAWLTKVGLPTPEEVASRRSASGAEAAGAAAP